MKSKEILRSSLLAWMFIPFFCLLFNGLAAQTDSLVVDTTVYVVADEAPRFPSRCEQYDTTAAAKSQCAQIALLRYISSRSFYPQEAREKGIQGSPVISFIVEADGTINQPKILRDPGGQLGMAALQAVLAMRTEVRWRPAIKDGKPVRYRYTLPVKFKLEDPKPYQLMGADTVYTELDTPLGYQGGTEALQAYFTESLNYPEFWQDSCLVGQITVSLLVQPDNIVRILDLTDYSNLGFDFWYEAIHATTSTYGNWIPATYQGRDVPAAFEVSMTFAPEGETCKTTVENYTKAINLAAEGNQMIAEKQVEEGIGKLTEAIDLFPYDGQLRIARGQALLDANRLNEACFDLAIARRIALVNWFDSVLPLICKPTLPEEQGEE
ncbi:MAG: energy transducer TonB [Bacteroidota bacterium]